MRELGPDAKVFIVSDSLGETAELVTRAALSQFDNIHPEVRRFPMVKSAGDIEGIVALARQQPTLIVYTLILPEAAETMRWLTELHGVEAIDVMGPFLSGLTQVLGIAPHLEAGRIRRLDEHYFKRVEAVEFAIKFDDSKDPRGFLQSDAVLVGLSRCSKTPVAMYLAHRNLRVASLPLVPELALPKEIHQIEPWKLVGLRVDPLHLSKIRQERVRTMHMPRGDGYSDLGRILIEMEYAERTFKRLGCPVIDVTNRAIEETAVLVVEYVEKGRQVAQSFSTADVGSARPAAHVAESGKESPT